MFVDLHGSTTNGLDTCGLTRKHRRRSLAQRNNLVVLRDHAEQPRLTALCGMRIRLLTVLHPLAIESIETLLHSAPRARLLTGGLAGNDMVEIDIGSSTIRHRQSCAPLSTGATD